MWLVGCFFANDHPRSASNVIVSLKPRFSKTVEARLIMMAEKGGALSAAHMVFHLKSKVEGRLSASSTEVDTKMYEPAIATVQVKNTFAMVATFKVEISEPNIPGVNDSRTGQRFRKQVPLR